MLPVFYHWTQTGNVVGWSAVCQSDQAMNKRTQYLYWAYRVGLSELATENLSSVTACHPDIGCQSGLVKGWVALVIPCGDDSRRNNVCKLRQCKIIMLILIQGNWFLEKFLLSLFNIRNGHTEIDYDRSHCYLDLISLISIIYSIYDWGLIEMHL